MSFELDIVFTGLCMFVPDPRSEQMHVLLADADHHAGHFGGKHYARLFYDEGYEEPGGELTKKWEKVKLDKRALLVPRFGPGAALTLPKQVMNLEPIVGKLPFAQVLNDPTSVKGRVTLGSGRITACAPGAFWRLGAREFCMTNAVVWTVEIPQDSIELPLARLKNGSKGWLDELFPIGGRIVLWVVNAMKDDMPGSGEPVASHGPPGEHFSAYYDLYQGSSNPGNPVLVKEVGNCPAGSEDPCGPGIWESERFQGPGGYRGADPHRCMVSGGTLS
jgi:hypothetical protein